MILKMTHEGRELNEDNSNSSRIGPKKILHLILGIMLIEVEFDHCGTWGLVTKVVKNTYLQSVIPSSRSEQFIKVRF